MPGTSPRSSSRESSRLFLCPWARLRAWEPPPWALIIRLRPFGLTHGAPLPSCRADVCIAAVLACSAARAARPCPGARCRHPPRPRWEVPPRRLCWASSWFWRGCPDRGFSFAGEAGGRRLHPTRSGGFRGDMILDCAPESESSRGAGLRDREARADDVVSFLSRREAMRRESPARGGAAEPGQPKKFRN